MEEERKVKIREQLESFHEWPSIFMFKFIFPSATVQLVDVKSKFPEEVEYAVKTSSGGKYTSLTVREMVMNSEDVFTRYKDVSSIEGVIAL
jgi:putative lipoic acid-binding regulatory protein